MLALSGVAAESMVRDVDWTMTDIGKRIERGLFLTALLRATLGTARSRAAEQLIVESVLVACESSVIYLRRNLGAVSVAAVADLVLVEAENPRSLVYQLERLRANLKALPGRRARRGRSGWSKSSAPGCAAWTRPTWRTSTPRESARS
ncbi:A predicted alpha-helical domain with a conserved ER motif family protein [Mycobacterium xenopi 4042]|uniref:A predicted alpha-helical domain with a conserved ER motif family protein n=1 Tax=Mycobacterium xenopi 4042 TaxID=1299334 RepID=X8AN95_MYCXE|nr:A predicted alpha-helical domain with a conserved ER motif family protein [Mycobacterium xenopi 4042]